MTADYISLFVIVALAAICPIFSDRVPNRIIPETVFLLIVGCVFGSNVLGVIKIDETISFLSELGCAFLFLLAGYEIDPKMLLGSQGKRGLGTWLVTFAIAYIGCCYMPTLAFGELETAAMAIMLTTTAIGTLAPILKERGLVGTPVGESVISYGTWGEIMPIFAIVLLLSTRKTWQTVVILLGLILLCVIIAARAAGARKRGEWIYRFLEAKADTTSQTFVRFTIFLLILLVTVSAVFDIDIVLGAFAAGFVLRFIIPEGNEVLEQKLDAIGYGFFIPLFFICSGAKVDVSAIAAEPLLLVAFISSLLLVRAVPVFIALSTGKDTRDMTSRSRVSVATYCATALPLIVAASSIAVDAGAMSQNLASVLVAAGAVTVFLMPLLGQLAYNIADVRKVDEVALEDLSLDDVPLVDVAPDGTPVKDVPLEHAASEAEHVATVAAVKPGGEGADAQAAGAQPVETKPAARQKKAHRRVSHHMPIATRFGIESLIYTGVPAEEVAEFVAGRMGFADDERRKALVAKRVNQVRERHMREVMRQGNGPKRKQQ